MSGKIRGEYWIKDGGVDFADGDIGDQNHEMVALNHVASKHIDDLLDYAEELGVGTEDFDRYDENPHVTTSELLGLIHHALVERGMASAQVAPEVIRRLGADAETYKMLGGGGDARLYVMKHDGWIAVRSNNIELFGFDEEKKKELVGGLEEILDEESVEVPDEDMEFSLYDHRTSRSSDVTLADLKAGVQFRPQTLPNTTYNKPLFVPPDRTKPMGSQSPRSMDARSRQMMQTSEGFRAWLESCGDFLVRRTWPFLTGADAEPQDGRASRRVRRRSRRSR